MSDPVVAAALLEAHRIANTPPATQERVATPPARRSRVLMRDRVFLAAAAFLVVLAIVALDEDA